MGQPKSGKVIAQILKNGGIGVLPTDTLYGLVGRAEDKEVIARIKKLKKRSAGKPFIVLISSLKDLAKFKIELDKKTAEFLKTIWPGPISVVVGKTAFRLPKNKFLQNLIKQTGPLVAPSANPEGSPPAETIGEAKKYFSNQVDFYLSASKRLSGQPSTLIKIKNGPPGSRTSKTEILRQGCRRVDSGAEVR